MGAPRPDLRLVPPLADEDDLPPAPSGPRDPLPGSNPPCYAPIPGGGRCDVCGDRAFRRTPSGIHRHERCEPASYHEALTARRMRRQPKDPEPCPTCGRTCGCRRRR